LLNREILSFGWLLFDGDYGGSLMLVDVLQILASLSVILGVPFFIIEYRRRGRDLGYQTYLAASQASIELEKILIDHPDIRDVVEEKGNVKYENVPQTKYYYNSLMILFENVYLCWKKGWMAEDEWDGWAEWMKIMMKRQDFQKAWEEEKKLYSKSFIKYMDSLKE
jgi:hypothetical protein